MLVYFLASCRLKNELANNITSTAYRVQNTKKCLLSIISSLLIKLVNVVYKETHLQSILHFNICWEHVRVSIVSNYNRTTKNNKLWTSCSLLYFILLLRSDRTERAATFKGNIQGETNSRIYHFLPGRIAFNQIALPFFLPECIAPRIKTWGSSVGESVHRSLPRLRVFFVANFLQQG